FLYRYRDDLFPNAPLVFVATKSPVDESFSPGRGITGLINLSAHRKTIDLVLGLQPDTKEVFVVSGTLQHDKRLEALARRELHGYEDRLEISYLTDYSLDELVAKVKTLPKRSILLYVWQQSQNEQGKVLESTDIFSKVAGSASVPIYGMST